MKVINLGKVAVIQPRQVCWFAHPCIPENALHYKTGPSTAAVHYLNTDPDVHCWICARSLCKNGAQRPESLCPAQ
eukprot:245357-Pelagomonas_calceolata.AAC.3